jgi:hypothetical protein
MFKMETPMVRVVLAVWLIVMSAGSILAQDTQQEPIKERVRVVNVEVVVRVFRKGKPVPGLKREDFILEVNGRPVPINGFYQMKKKITQRTIASETADARKSRLFILIFNVSDYTLDMEDGIKQLFQTIIRPGDRLMVITNDFFLHDRLVANPAVEEKKLLKILEVESKKYQYLFFNSRNVLQAFLRSFYDEWKSMPELRDSTILKYQDMYLHYLRDFKKYFLSINESQYIEIAEYIKKERLETWVLNFYQIGGWYRPHLNSTLEYFLLQNEVIHELEVGMDLPVRKLSRLFAGTSATFQTILMRPVRQTDIRCDFYDHETEIGSTDWQFDFTFLPTPSENLLKRTSVITGGVLATGNRIDRFLQRVVEREDVSYTLTYVPEGSKASDRVTVRVKQPGCRVYYNNQPVKWSPSPEPKGKKGAKPQVVLHHAKFSGKHLFIKAAGFFHTKVGGTLTAKARLRIRILNARYKSFYDRFRDFVFTNELEQRIRFREKFLRSGAYYMIVEVSDLQSRSSDMIIYDLKVDKTGRIVSMED